MKNCTKHSLERWVERIVGITDIRERKEYIAKNSDILKEHINKTLEYAEFIYKGQIGDNITRNYYIHNDIILVLNTANDAVVTVYKVDFGFPHELNLQVAKGLLAEIRRLSEEKGKLDLAALEEIERLKATRDSLDQQEEILKEQLRLIQERKKAIDEEIKTHNSEAKVVELDIKKYTQQLVNSKEYKEDLLLCLSVGS
jgi:Chromosome segregation ATPases